MSIEIKRAKPDDYQDALLQKYHNAANVLLEMIGEYKVNFELQNAITRIYESIFWFNTSIMNCSAEPLEHKASIEIPGTIN